MHVCLFKAYSASFFFFFSVYTNQTITFNPIIYYLNLSSCSLALSLYSPSLTHASILEATSSTASQHLHTILILTWFCNTSLYHYSLIPLTDPRQSTPIHFNTNHLSTPLTASPRPSSSHTIQATFSFFFYHITTFFPSTTFQAPPTFPLTTQVFYSHPHIRPRGRLITLAL